MLNERFLNELQDVIHEYFGGRCDDFESGCPCCEAWVMYDILLEKYNESTSVSNSTTDENRGPT